MATPENNKNQLQIQLRPDMADGKYSNLAMIGHGPNEFLIDFIFAAPGMPQDPVVSRVIMRSRHAPGSGGKPRDHEPRECKAAHVCDH